MSIKQAYESLFDCMEGSEKYRMEFITKQRPYYTAIAGYKYKSCCSDNGNPFRFMMVGRATNGWNEYEKGGNRKKVSFVQASLDNLYNESHTRVVPHSKDRFEWIATPSEDIARNQIRYGIDPNPLAIEKSPYNLKKSQFWSYTKDIWCSLQGKNSPWSERWFENIVWSNLYKIASKSENSSVKANPPEKLMRETASACISILQEEIELFKPTHILFLTGWDWFNNSSFSSRFSSIFNDLLFVGRNKYRGGTNDIYVEGTAKYRGAWGCANAVIACRPEGRDKAKYVSQVCRAFIDQ